MFLSEMAVTVWNCFLVLLLIGEETWSLPSAAGKLNIHVHSMETRSL